MAAIIARMAAANWERKKGGGWRSLGSDKSNKQLPPFDPAFLPEVHNMSVRAKKAKDERLNDKKREFFIRNERSVTRKQQWREGERRQRFLPARSGNSHGPLIRTSIKYANGIDTLRRNEGRGVPMEEHFVCTYFLFLEAAKKRYVL